MTGLRLKDLWRCFRDAKAPKLVALGTQDTFCSVGTLEKRLESPASPCDVKIYQGGDHFWTRGGSIAELRRDVLEWAEKAIKM